MPPLSTRNPPSNISNGPTLREVKGRWVPGFHFFLREVGLFLTKVWGQNFAGTLSQFPIAMETVPYIWGFYL